MRCCAVLGTAHICPPVYLGSCTSDARSAYCCAKQKRSTLIWNLTHTVSATEKVACGNVHRPWSGTGHGPLRSANTTAARRPSEAPRSADGRVGELQPLGAHRGNAMLICSVTHMRACDCQAAQHSVAREVCAPAIAATVRWAMPFGRAAYTTAPAWCGALLTLWTLLLVRGVCAYFEHSRERSLKKLAPLGPGASCSSAASFSVPNMRTSYLHSGPNAAHHTIPYHTMPCHAAPYPQ